MYTGMGKNSYSPGTLSGSTLDSILNFGKGVLQAVTGSGNQQAVLGTGAQSIGTGTLILVAGLALAVFAFSRRKG